LTKRRGSRNRTLRERKLEVEQLIRDQSPIPPTSIGTFANVELRWVKQIVLELQGEGKVRILPHRVKSKAREVWWIGKNSISPKEAR